MSWSSSGARAGRVAPPLAVLLLGLSLGSPAHGQGFELGAHAGYALPLGEIAGAEDLADTVQGQFPVGLGLGYRVVPELFLGAYVEYGPGLPGKLLGEACREEDASCSVDLFSIGLQAQYHVAPGSGFDLWFGLGAGYESLDVEFDFGAGRVVRTFSGLPQWRMQFGIDFGHDWHVAYGPFVGLSLDTYADFEDVASNGRGSSRESQDVERRALHQWLSFGFRGTFVL